MTVRNTKPTRDRILNAAKHLFQQRGYHAIGTAEILDVARAPKGSMYHHFSEGKEQIAIAVVDAIRADVTASLTKLQRDGLSTADIVRTLAKRMAAWLKASQFREGTLLASTTIGTVPDLPKLHAAVQAAFAEWRSEIAKLLMMERWTKAAASTMASTLLAGIEGAMILARVDEDERTVIKVADTLAGLIEDRRN